MYRMKKGQLVIEDFYLPFGGDLKASNKWVKLAEIIPWDEIETLYAKSFTTNGMGAPAKPVRMALGALIIKEKCRFTDRETVEHITENPYLQYFIGLHAYVDEPPFDPSMMVHFRKRLGLQTIHEINELICQTQQPSEEDEHDDQSNDSHHDDTDSSESGDSGQEATKEEAPIDPATIKKQGKLILDATCAPADIRFPTDLSLLNEAREKLEALIDTLFRPLRGEMRKPRTYRIQARKNYLSVSKQKKPTLKAMRRAIGKQLKYVARDLRIVERLQTVYADRTNCSPRQARQLLVIQELYQQQKSMYDQREHRVDDRIVSISQPHVRPIVRGKATAYTEFGAKLAISLVNGYSFIEHLSWNSFNEGKTLQDALETYHQRFGYYPEAVVADTIYRNRENLQYCKKLGIRLSGPRLGRPSHKEIREQRKLERQDLSERNAVEGKFGEGKRAYGLGRIMARLKDTAETVIGLQFLVMNLEHRLRVLCTLFMKWLFSGRPVIGVA